MILERAGFAFVERWSDRLPGKFCGEKELQRSSRGAARSASEWT
jgi:hypothetical protein